MSTQYSTGLLTYIAATGSLKAALDGGYLHFFSGPVPPTPDDAIDASSVLLARYTVNGDGTTALTFSATPVSGSLVKTPTEAWQSTVAATGTATFFRFSEATDDSTTASTTFKRVQGTLGTTAATDGILATTALTTGQTSTINAFQLS